MNKSKFLKKSLAMVLAIMMVVAMIPLSAAAAYAPASGLKPVVENGEVTAVSGGWNIVFDYDDTLPTINFETGNVSEAIHYLDKDYKEQSNGLSGIQVWEDENGDPAPITFWVVKGGEASDRYTINWSMKAAATEVYVKSATLGDYTGVVNEAKRTIKFTLPFAYGSVSNTDVKVEFNGAKQDGQLSPASIAVDTYKTKGVPGTITVQPQANNEDITYTITVEEEKALKTVTIGDYEGVFKTNPSDPNKGYQTGTVEFNVPADITDKDLKEAVFSFTAGSDYAKATYTTGGPEVEITSGTVLTESVATAMYASLTGSGLNFKLYNDGGVKYNEYTLKFVKDSTDTTITGFTVKGDNNIVEDGVVSGNELTAVVSSDCKLSDIDLVFEGPKYPGAGSQPRVDVIDQSKNANFDTTGVTTEITGVNCTSTVRLKVTAADGQTQEFYNLTVTKAAAPNNDPAVTAAKLTMYKGTDDELEVIGSISGSTITFNVPYSTLDAAIKNQGTTEYTFAKTSLTTLTDTTADATFDKGATVTVTSDNNTQKVYTVKYVKDPARTGKSISNFVLSTADNKYLMSYNNYKNYNVAVSSSKFSVTLPTNPGTLYGDFVLSEGAKLYKSDKTPVSTYSTKTGTGATAIDTAATYFVADEYLATILANGTSDTFAVLKEKYPTHMTVYDFVVTRKDQEGKRLTALSADDGKVSATIDGTDITLTVPYGYVQAGEEKSFFFDYTVDAGATLKIKSSPDVTVYNGGLKSYDADKEKVVAEDAAWTGNPDFVVKKSGDKYVLYTVNGNNDATSLLKVVAENGQATDYTIKEIKVADANKDAAITSLKVNNVAATISGKNITVELPFGTNLAQSKLSITASEMATVKIGNNEYDAEKVYDLTKPLDISVKSEDGATTNVYTVKATVAEQFSDVLPGSWYYDFVMDAVDAGIVTGMGNGIFKPAGNITRGDFALMTVRMLGVDVSSYTSTPFSDVDDSKWYAQAVAYCADKGIISGVGDGRFAPESYITREQAAKILAEALELDETTLDKFNDDAKIAGWAKDYVYACKAAGIFEGDNKGNFNPKKNITRAETAKVMVVAQSK